MATQKSLSKKNKKYTIGISSDWKYLVYFHKHLKVSHSGPWSYTIAVNLMNDLLLNNICAWIKTIDEGKQ